ncbi:MAG: hypothetical protein JNM62_00395 [Flavobacteriales bacterium]|nr:hypothetical protein [Flavobacteriales bacterium]
MKDRLPIRLAQCILVIVLLRHLAVACFVHPFADDFSYAVAGMRTDLGVRLVQEYTSWNGRYFSDILLLRGPLTLGIEEGLGLYRAVAAALILFTWLAANRFVRSLLPSATREISATIALVFVLIFLHVMPNTSEGFYWYTGAITYQLPNALSLFLVANWIGHLRSPHGTLPWRWFVVQVLLVITIAGCNEVHMAFLVIGHALLFVYLRVKEGHIARPALILLGISMLCAIVVIAAPGNETRGSNFPMRHDVLRTLAYSTAQTARFGGLAFLSLPVFILTLNFPSIRREAIARGILRPFARPLNKWLALAFPFVCLFTAMVVTYWPTGLLGQHRTVNMGLFYFMVTWFFAALVWDQTFFEPRKAYDEGVLRWPWSLVMIGASFLFLGRGMDLTWELCDGTLARYDRAMNARYEAIRTTPDGELVLPPVEWPKSLTVLRLDTSSVHWMNLSMADYFGRPGLRLIEPAPAPQE